MLDAQRRLTPPESKTEAVSNRAEQRLASEHPHPQVSEAVTYYSVKKYHQDNLLRYRVDSDPQKKAVEAQLSAQENKFQEQKYSLLWSTNNSDVEVKAILPILKGELTLVDHQYLERAIKGYADSLKQGSEGSQNFLSVSGLEQEASQLDPGSPEFIAFFDYLCAYLEVNIQYQRAIETVFGTHIPTNYNEYVATIIDTSMRVVKLIQRLQPQLSQAHTDRVPAPTAPTPNPNRSSDATQQIQADRPFTTPTRLETTSQQEQAPQRPSYEHLPFEQQVEMLHRELSIPRNIFEPKPENPNPNAPALFAATDRFLLSLAGEPGGFGNVPSIKELKAQLSAVEPQTQAAKEIQRKIVDCFGILNNYLADIYDLVASNHPQAKEAVPYLQKLRELHPSLKQARADALAKVKGQKTESEPEKAIEESTPSDVEAQPDTQPPPDPQTAPDLSSEIGFDSQSGLERAAEPLSQSQPEPTPATAFTPEPQPSAGPQQQGEDESKPGEQPTIASPPES